MAGSGYLVSITNNVATTHPDEAYVDSAVANAIAESTAYSNNLSTNTLLNANSYAEQAVSQAISQAITDIFPPLVEPIDPITGYGALEWYNVDTDKYYTIRDELYINAMASLAFVQGKAYTNEKIASITQITNEYTDNAVANVLISANNYTDLQVIETINIVNEQIAQISLYVDNKTWTTSQITDFDTQLATNLTTAKNYADSGDSSTLLSAKSYSDSGDTTTLNTAKSYTDNKTWTANNITDLAATVKAYKLSDFAVPVTNINLNNYKIINSADATNPQDLVNLRTAQNLFGSLPYVINRTGSQEWVFSNNPTMQSFTNNNVLETHFRTTQGSGYSLNFQPIPAKLEQAGNFGLSRTSVVNSVYNGGWIWVTNEVNNLFTIRQPLDVYNNKITSVADPVNPTDGSNKRYADSKDESTLASAKSYADTNDITTLNSAKTYADSLSSNFVGDTKLSVQQADHSNWLIWTNGRSLSRTTHAALWALVVSGGLVAKGMFGNGNGTTTFTMGDIQSRSLGIARPGSGLTLRALGDKFGAESITNVPTHNHTINHDHASATTSSDTHNHAFAHTHPLDHTHPAVYTTNTGHTHTIKSGLSYVLFRDSGTSGGYADYDASGGAGPYRIIVSDVATTVDSATHNHAVAASTFTGNTTSQSSSTTNSDSHTHTVDLASYFGTSGNTGSSNVNVMNPTVYLNLFIYSK